MGRFEGDDMIASIDLQIWSVIREILLRWNTLVIFRWFRYSVPDQSPGLVQFFVPGDSRHRYEIEKFIMEELGETLNREPHDMGFSDGSGKFPGTKMEVVRVGVSAYSGMNPHVDRAVVEKMAREMTTRFISEIKRMQKEKEKESDA
jgi:hypothetical protein